MIANRPSERARQRAGRRLPFACVARGRRSRAARRVRRRRLIHVPVACDRANGIAELLRRESSDFRTAKHVPARLFADSRNRAHLIRLGRYDRRHQPFQVVPSVDEIAREPIEQSRTPRHAIHLVRVLDDAAPEEPMPHPVDHRPGHASVARIGEDGSRGAPAVGQRTRRRHAIQLGKQERRSGVCILRHVAAIQPQASVGREEAREAVRVLQLPLADEAVVARVALEIDSEEELRAVLRRLHCGRLARAHFASPIDTDEEPVGISSGRRIQELINEPVVGHVRGQRAKQPGTDAFAG